MQHKKLGMAVVWMVCLLAMVAVVWSRPPLGGSQESHPTLALSAPQPAEPAKAVEPEHSFKPVPVAAPMVPPARFAHASPAENRVLPNGEWVRELPPYKVSLAIEGHRLFASVSGTVEEDVDVDFQMSADYHITQDSILYGIITSANLTIADAETDDQLEAELAAQKFFDQPFAIRFRLDEDVLTIKSLQIGTVLEDADVVVEASKLIAGRYHPLEPAAAPLPPAARPVRR